MYNAGHPKAVLCDNLEGWGGERCERGFQDGGEHKYAYGIAREKKNFPTKSSNLRHCLACSQNKGLSEYQRRASQLRTSPSPTRGREAGGQHPESEGKGQTQP